MKKKRTAAIVHYNTPELTEATIRSLWKSSGKDWQVVVLDNSDERPFLKRLRGVRRIDNTKGQIINWDEFLAQYPLREESIGRAKGCNFGSAKHMRSVQELWHLLPDGFLLIDPDVLIREDINFMWREDECAVGHVKERDNGLYNIPRMVPMLCYINVPMCVAGGAVYFDDHRCWGLQPGFDNMENWWDTGAAFLDDIKRKKPQCHGLRIDIQSLIVHFEQGSWLRNDIEKHKEWLERHKDFWQ